MHPSQLYSHTKRPTPPVLDYYSPSAVQDSDVAMPLRSSRKLIIMVSNNRCSPIVPEEECILEGFC